MLQHVGAEGWIHLLPAAQVRCSFVEQVTVAGREQVLHEDHGGADGNQQEELAGPAFVVVLSVLGGTGRWDRVWTLWDTFGQPHLPKASPHEAPGQAGKTRALRGAVDPAWKRRAHMALGDGEFLQNICAIITTQKTREAAPDAPHARLREHQPLRGQGRPHPIYQQTSRIQSARGRTVLPPP